MRPLKLIMSGFESYCDRTEVDFEKLGSSGLYLIFGDTGAGKTTIFDAITFALYGTSSGENRKEDMLRSLMADDTIPTFVELTFETNGKIYKVTRNPAYERKSQRGGKQVKQDADATLEFITDRSHPPVTKKSVVTKEIEEILKLKKDQFCRIAMIAQGAFQKLLLSETKDKEEIFRDLFNTTKYQKLQLRLSEEIKKLTAENQTLKNNLQLYLDGISIPETNENFEALSKLRITLLVTEEDLKNLTLVVEKDNKASAEIKKEIGVYEKKLIEINTAIVAEENRKKIQDNICEENTPIKCEINTCTNDLNNCIFNERQCPNGLNVQKVADYQTSKNVPILCVIGAQVYLILSLFRIRTVLPRVATIKLKSLKLQQILSILK